MPNPRELPTVCICSNQEETLWQGTVCRFRKDDRQSLRVKW